MNESFALLLFKFCKYQSWAIKIIKTNQVGKKYKDCPGFFTRTNSTRGFSNPKIFSCKISEKLMSTSKMIVLADARINAIISISTRPNQAFRDVTENHINYFATVITIPIVMSFFFIRYTIYEPYPSLQSIRLGISVMWCVNLKVLKNLFYWILFLSYRYFTLQKNLVEIKISKKVFFILVFIMIIGANYKFYIWLKILCLIQL